MRQLIPFNYVVPGESVNQLVDLRKLLAGFPTRAHVEAMQTSIASDGDSLPFNEFSGPEYRVINFVADLPLRLDRLLPRGEHAPEGSHVIFALTEFQVADKDAAVRNESGASSHDAYKARQHERVRLRLFRGEQPRESVTSAPASARASTEPGVGNKS